MAQNREAPAYQEYPAAMMARIPYRAMTLAGRGLLYTLRLECWVNRTVPANPRTLARVLGYPPEDIHDTLPEVLPFFELNGDHLRCPELDDYRAHLEGIRERQSQGGKQGAAKTNGRHQKPSAQAGPGDSPSNPRPTRESLVQPSSVQPNSMQVLSEEPVTSEFVKDYEQAESYF